MNGRGLYGRRFATPLSAPNPWATSWAPVPFWAPPPIYGSPPPPFGGRPPFYGGPQPFGGPRSPYVGATEQALANAAVAPAVTGPARASVPVPTVVVQPDKGVTVGSILKFGAIGALVIGGAVAASSLFQTVKKGKEPVRYYADLYREQRGKGSR